MKKKYEQLESQSKWALRQIFRARCLPKEGVVCD